MPLMPIVPPEVIRKNIEKSPEETNIPIIGEIEDEKKLSTFDLKTKYKKYFQTHFQGHQYRNKDTGLVISVSSDCVNQWVKKSRTRERIILIQILDFLLENGKYEGLPVPDRKNRSEIENFKYFYCFAVINLKRYKVILKMVKPRNKPHKFYYYSLERAEGIKKPHDRDTGDLR